MRNHKKIGVLSCPTSISVSMLLKENNNIKTTKTKQVSINFSVTNNLIVDGKLTDHDDAIRKLQQEIKMIKM